MENKTFNNILIAYSEKLTEKHLSCVEKIKNIISELNKNYNTVKVSDLQESHFKNLDLAITIGGDGTFIRTSHFIRTLPILGINSEPELSEGALTSLQESEIGTLEEILNKNYQIIKRPRLRITRNNKLIKELALNEVYVGATNQFHTSRYIIRLNGEEEEHRSSGALIVTGSGSTAWYKSAGGTPFDYKEEKLKLLVREPFVSRIFNPQILNREINKNEKIIFESKRDNGGIIAIDSNKTYEFNCGDIVEIRLSNQPLNVIIKNEN